MSDVSKTELFARASAMPKPEQVEQNKRVGGSKKQKVVKLVTPDVRVYVHHMVMVSGHSDCGSHTFIPEFEQQVRRKLHIYNNEFHGKDGCDPSCPVDGSLREFQRVFQDYNLFRLWENFVKGGQALDPYRWYMVSLVYRRRSDAEIRKLVQDARKSDKKIDENQAKYVFVATYASIASLITSVMAWQARKLTGWVQVGLDNVYNVLKAVPNVSLLLTLTSRLTG
jgi:hypothetical protein